MSSKRELIEMGVDPRIAARSHPPLVKNRAGEFCRDRLAWGGITFPDRCSCVGRCDYDLERKK